MFNEFLSYVMELKFDKYGLSILIFVVILLLLLAIAFIYILWQNHIMGTKNSNTKRELNHIINSIHVGFVDFVANGNYKILYANKGFFDIIGYKEDEVLSKRNESILHFIHPLDLSQFLKFNFCEENSNLKKEFRFFTKDEKIVWVLIKGSLIHSKNGNKMISAVVVDITDSIRMRERILLEEERYHVAAEISQDIMFEYILDEDIMILADKFKELYGMNSTILNFSNIYMNNKNFICSEDIGVFVEFIRMLRSGKEVIESEFRIYDNKNDYVWCHIRGKTLYSEDKMPQRVIGKIINIDLYKKELQTLEYKAKRDPLTNVYNKCITKELIDDFIEKNSTNLHIFMLIDIDDFKVVNDKYGHIQGDNILTLIINQVKDIFNSGEIIGRIGGDEFVVFIGNITDELYALEKAELLNKTLRATFQNEDSEIVISCSIGISMYHQDGKNYDELLCCADKALYVVKGQGKDGFKLFT